MRPRRCTDELSRRRFLHLAAGLGAGLTLGAGRAPGQEGAIRTRRIPATNEPLPVVGLGTWLQFNVGASPEVRAPLREVLRRLFAGGGSVIDSSPMYGSAEAVVGDLLAAMDARDKAFLATKVWTSGRQRGIGQMEASRERFRADTLDLMQVHNLVDWQTHLPTLRAWKDAGKIRYLGLTHYTTGALDDLARIVEREPVDFVQCAYSIGVPEAAERLLPLCAERGVAVLVNRPYEGGRLFRSVRGRDLPPWAADLGIASWGQFFLKWILGHPAVTCVIPGTSDPGHMSDNLGAGRGPLPDPDQRRRMRGHWRSL